MNILINNIIYTIIRKNVFHVLIQKSPHKYINPIGKKKKKKKNSQHWKQLKNSHLTFKSGEWSSSVCFEKTCSMPIRLNLKFPIGV